MCQPSREIDSDEDTPPVQVSCLIVGSGSHISIISKQNEKLQQLLMFSQVMSQAGASSIIRYRLWRIWAAPAKRFFPITSSANSWREAPDCLLSDIPFPNNPRNCLPFTRRVGSKRKEVCENHQRNSKRILLPMCSRLCSPWIKSFLLMHEAIPAETLKLSFVSHRMEKLVSWKW